MPKTTPKRRPRATRRQPVTPYLGGQRFKSIGEVDFGTNEQHVRLILQEFPYLRLTVGGLLNKTDGEVEAMLRKAGPTTRRELFQHTLAEQLVKIRGRHQAIVEICDSGLARLAIVVDRIERGPRATSGQPHPWEVVRA